MLLKRLAPSPLVMGHDSSGVASVSARRPITPTFTRPKNTPLVQLSTLARRRLDEEQTRYSPENEWQRPASTLSLPIGELALCYFASNFMLIPRRPFGGRFFEFIVPVLQGQAPDSAVQYALRACAFSALGNRWVSETVDFHAIGLSQYTAALAKTTQSLKDPRLKTADATLATVLLLGLFEVRIL